jgi:hypothetical protein
MMCEGMSEGREECEKEKKLGGTEEMVRELQKVRALLFENR